MFIITKYCYGNTLKDSLAKHENKGFEEPRLIRIAQSIGEGLKFLHDKRILHRNIKLENILLTNNSELAKPIICNLGSARYETDI